MARQLKIAGTERDKSTIFEDIETAASKYVDLRDKRMEAGRKEKEAKDALLASMKEHKKTSYPCDTFDYDVNIIPGERKLKVTKRDAPEPEDGEEETT